MTDLITLYLQVYGEKTHAPTMFGRLSAIHAIGCVMGHKFTCPLQPFNREFNTYVAIIAKSRSGKTTASKILKLFLAEPRVGFPICSNQLTPEALMEELVDIPVSTLIRDEIGGDLAKMRTNQYMSALPDFLCDLWDTYGVYNKRTRAKGVETIEHPYFNMWMATTDIRFNTYMQNEFILNGWIPRYMIFFMKDEDRLPYKRAGTDISDGAKKNIIEIVDRLARIYKFKNSVKMTFEDLDLFNDYYEKFNVTNPNPQVDALYGRAGEHMLKVAGISKIAHLSMSDLDRYDVPGSEIIIDTKYVKSAYKFIDRLMSRAKEVLGSYIEWENKSMTVKYVQQHIVTQQEMFLKNKTDVIDTKKTDLFKVTHSDKKTLDEVLSNLFARDAILKVRVRFEKAKQNRDKEIFITRPFLRELKEHSNNVILKGVSTILDGECDTSDELIEIQKNGIQEMDTDDD